MNSKKGKKRGRPEKPMLERRDIPVHIRFDIRDYRLLNELCRKTGLNKSELVRLALNNFDIYY